MMFKHLASSLAEPLCVLFQHIFRCETIPSIWKHAYVTPVFKKGKSSLVQNYRPISLTSVVCKIFESLIKLDLVNFLAANDLITSDQHGFMAKRSTCTNIMETLNDWTLTMKDGYYTRVAYIDFARAFDSVCHSKLIYKLSCLGVGGSLLAVLTSYLDNRTQQVKIQNALSKSVFIKSGVPQGSVLGPVLFVIYINELGKLFPEPIKSKYFADDAKMYSQITSNADLNNFQGSLDMLSTWANSWQLSISVNKCCTMDITCNNRIISDSNVCNSVDDIKINNVQQIRDLGVIVDSKLKFTAHIAKIVSTAKQRTALLYRAFLTREQKFLIIAYKSYILPLVEYCSPIWSPNSVGDILLLESVQRSFTKRIPGLENMSYDARLKALNMITLERRRLHFDLIFCFKLLKGLIGGVPENYGLVLSTRKSRVNSFKLVINNPRIDARKYFFSSRICEPWNSLPDSVVLLNNVNSFKCQLFNIDFNKFLLFKSCT